MNPRPPDCASARYRVRWTRRCIALCHVRDIARYALGMYCANMEGLASMTLTPSGMAVVKISVDMVRILDGRRVV
jgi:hypothetical protein